MVPIVLSSETAAGQEATRVLLVCTANMCRSRMAESLLRARVRERGLSCGVSSRGLMEGGHPTPQPVRSAMGQLGGDSESLVRASRQIATGDVERAGIVLGMAREHVRSTVVMAPDSWPRTFTLKELVRRGSAIGSRAHGEAVAEWLARAHLGRRHSEMMGSSEQDDVIDPIGGSDADYRRTAAELAELVGQLVLLIWPSQEARLTSEDGG